MSYAFCNNIALQHVKLVSHDKVNELAGPSNLVRVRHTIKVRGLYNPAHASYLFNAAGGAAKLGPVYRPGASAPDTEAAVQWALQQPRKPFAFVAGGVLVIFGPKPVTVLRTPGAPKIPPLPSGTPFLGANLFAPSTIPPRSATPFVGTPLLDVSALVSRLGTDLEPVAKQKFGIVDVANGPISTARVVENIGDKTFMVEWEITTWVHDEPASRGISKVKYPTSPLLAQEYSMVHTIDQDFFTTRQVEGRAIFRSDALEVLQLFPDQLRYWLGHPIPAGFSRSQIQVRAESDNLTLAYRFTDQQRVLNYDPNIFTRVEMTASFDTETLGLESVLRSGIGGALNTFLPIRTVARAMAGWIPFVGGGLANVLGAAGALASGALIGRLAGVPVTHYIIQGRFWGHPDRDRKNFERDAGAEFARLIADYSSVAGWGNLGDVAGMASIPSELVYDNPIPAGAGDIASHFLGGGRIRIPIPILGGFGMQMGDMRFRKRTDLSGMFVEIENHYMGSRLQSALNTLQLPAVAASIVGGEAVPATAPARPWPPPKADRAPAEARPILQDPMHGTYLGACVANALRDSGDLWEQVQDPPAVRNKAVKRRPGGAVQGVTLP